LTLHTYLPQDRLRALARGKTLPDLTSGAALFADISGFTALTEALRITLGPRRGAEELTRRMEAVYSTLIAEIERYGGSVISFAGDSMLCWFDEKGAGELEVGSERSSPSALAVACGLSLQSMMRAYANFILPGNSSMALTLKVAIASGAARRLIVGDPKVQQMDVIVGATITRASTAEHHAHSADVILDEETVNVLGSALTIQEWRTGENGEHFAVVTQFPVTDIAPSIHTTLPPLEASRLMSWIPSPVFEREQHRHETFLTEFRPCVALFIRFTGIDYDSDAAESELDAFIRKVQRIATKHAGTLLDLNIGDKGSYTYVNFGALSAHEDDTRRAVKTALELNKASELRLQMGIAQGLMRVGAYGGATRKTFGALGDEVNLAARLMTTAAPNEILLGGHAHKAVANEFAFEPRPPLPMKGKAEPLPVFALTGEREQRAIRLQEPSYTLPMVGRQHELENINLKLEMALQNMSQIIGIVAEAGMGKSRLIAEVIRSARKKGFVGYGGACESSGSNTPYLAWKPIWQAFFDVDPSAPVMKQLRILKGEIEDRVPERVKAMPLLGILLNLDIPENDFTKNLEPKYKQSALRALLEDCLRVESKQEPLLIVIEDSHWLDALSLDLLEDLARALRDCRVCFVLAYRLLATAMLQSPLQVLRFEAMPNFTRIELHELSQGEVEQAIRAKLAQLYPARSGGVPIRLVDKLMTHAQGNPFYLEELLNYLHDRGLDPLDPDDLKKIELPDSLHTLILSRLDQLSESEKMTLRVASIIGRLFHAAWLMGFYPELGDVPQIKADLDQLAALDITALDTPEPDLAYLFKHIVTHEVTYESLSFATRAKLHEQLARYLENMGMSLDSIAYHYGRSENTEKQHEYFRKAGEAAQKNFANDAALEYYGKLLPLLEDAKEQTQIHMQRGQVLELMGKWNRTEAEADYRAALDSARGNPLLELTAMVALGKLNRLRGDHVPALDWLAQAKAARTVFEDTEGLAPVLIETGKVLYRIGEYAQANENLNEGLALARERGDMINTALALDALGGVVGAQGDDVAAWALYEESLALMREIGDKAGISDSLNGMGNLATKQGDYAKARALFEESLALHHEIGNQHGNMVLLHNLAYVFYFQGDFRAARKLFEEILAPTKEMDDKTGIGYVLFGLGLVELAENNPVAREHILHSLRLRQEMGEQVQQTASLIGAAGLAFHEGNAPRAAQLLGAVESVLKALNAAVAEEVVHFHAQTVATVRKQLGEQAFQAAWAEGATWSLEEAVELALDM
jgi:adenylate cyclase